MTISRLFIAEKPSMGRAIAEVLGITGKADGSLLCKNGDAVTWAAGHLLEQADPEHYLPAEARGPWSKSAHLLPIIPAQWILQPKDDRAKSQLAVIKRLLSDTQTVVHAGDPDREGQAIVDEILKHLGWSGATLRLWLPALDPENVKKALDAMVDNKVKRGLWAAQEARSRADWLCGMNLTRTYTLSAGSLMAVGRVKTPTLALVVRRDESIEAFKPRDYFMPVASFQHSSGTYKGTAILPEDLPGLDEEGRLLDKARADAMAQAASGQPGTIKKLDKKAKAAPAPLPYSLLELQKTASAKFGMAAGKVLEIAQALYEKKMTSYPRTDCRYLPEEQHGAAKQILGKLSHPATGAADSTRKHAAWDSKKITAHHAIIPTGQGTALEGDEAKIYKLIVEAYIRLFYHDWRYEDTQILTACGGYDWKTTGRRTLDAGWKAVSGGASDEDDEEESGLPAGMRGFQRGDAGNLSSPHLPQVAQSDGVKCTDAQVVAKKTQPAKRYTDGTLLEAMASIHKTIDDPAAKARLKETSGLGTEATRAATIEGLIAQGFLAKDGKGIVSTATGRSLVHALEKIQSPLVDPVLTAAWEDALSDIAEGKAKFSEFMAKLTGDLREWTGKKVENPDAVPCPACGEKAAVRLKSKAGKDYWRCTSCSKAFGDDAGKPGRAFGDAPAQPAGAGVPCPGCGKAECRQATSAKGNKYWKCSGCGTAFGDDAGKPGKAFGDKPAAAKKRA